MPFTVAPALSPARGRQAKCKTGAKPAVISSKTEAQVCQAVKLGFLLLRMSALVNNTDTAGCDDIFTHSHFITRPEFQLSSARMKRNAVDSLASNQARRRASDKNYETHPAAFDVQGISIWPAPEEHHSSQEQNAKLVKRKQADRERIKVRVDGD